MGRVAPGTPSSSSPTPMATTGRCRKSQVCEGGKTRFRGGSARLIRLDNDFDALAPLHDLERFGDAVEGQAVGQEIGHWYAARGDEIERLPVVPWCRPISANH